MGDAISIDARNQYNLVELEMIAHRYSIDFVKVKAYYDDYEAFRQKTGGELPREKMVKLFTKVIGDTNNRDVNMYVNSLYKAFDRDNNGTLEFEEFLIGYYLLNSKDERLRLKFAFKMYDSNKIGKVNISDIITSSRSFARALNLDLPLLNDREFMQKLIIDLDVDRNGWINEAEFIDGISKNRVCKEYLAGFV